MRNIVEAIPRKNDGKFCQDVLGKSLLEGIPTKEVDAALADTRPQRRLRALLQVIDQRIAKLTKAQTFPEGDPAQQQKPAA